MQLNTGVILSFGEPESQYRLLIIRFAPVTRSQRSLLPCEFSTVSHAEHRSAAEHEPFIFGKCH